MKTEYRSAGKNIAAIRGQMAKVKRNGSPAEERRAVDSWIADNGENPSITKLEDRYLKTASRS